MEGSSKKHSTKDELAERDEEATSKDTLKDVAGKEKTARSNEPHDKPPSPDGALDENREIKDSDPM
jgi:hypothetical protein